MKNVFIIVIFILSGINFLPAQNYIRQLGIPVTVNTNQLKFPWVGGINATAFNEIDLNGDGIMDLFLFEKEGPGDYAGTFRFSTFINTGTPNQVSYVYAPQYENKFPPTLHDWAVTVDYDCDGNKDIFAYAPLGGIEVWHNDYNTISGLSFHLEYPLLLSQYGSSLSNIFVSRVNQAALADLDGDGDLDILAQANLSSTIEYHRNKAMELYGRCDTLVMKLETSSWGRDTLDPNKNTLRYMPPDCPFDSFQVSPFRIQNGQDNQGLHSGTCMAAFDRDGDGDFDLLNGDILATNMLYIQNCGTADTACGCSEDTLFPVYNIPVNMGNLMPGPYYLDVDNDGNKDLIVTPCSGQVRGNQNYSNVYFYKNVMNNQDNVFNYVQDRLIVEDMIDAGSNSMPVLLDVDGDGLQDLIIGSLGYFDSSSAGYNSGLTFFKNTGSAQCPAYILDNMDYDNFSSLGYHSISPTFGDLDGDGDKDMIFGEDFGRLVYCTNISGAAQSHWTLTTPNFGNIDVGSSSMPQLVDVDRDSLLDLLIGEADGNINYYRNTGTVNNPVFSFITNHFGAVDVTWQGISNYGYSAPFLYDDGSGYELLVGSERGTLFHFTNIDNNLSGSFTLVDSIAYGIHEPGQTTIARDDINGDGFPELILGNYAGGLTMYSQNICNPSGINSGELPIRFSIYPNPAKDFVVIKFVSAVTEKRQIEIYNMIGQKVYTKQSTASQHTINIKDFSNGMYICKIIESGQTVNRKFVVKK